MWRGLSKGRSAKLVGIAQPIDRCDEFKRIGRGFGIQRRMRPSVVIVFDPVREFRVCVVNTDEQAFVEQFVVNWRAKLHAETQLRSVLAVAVVRLYLKSIFVTALRRMEKA
jgi:hypothetical protein